jgi:hypothetical protein
MGHRVFSFYKKGCFVYPIVQDDETITASLPPCVRIVVTPKIKYFLDQGAVIEP